MERCCITGFATWFVKITRCRCEGIRQKLLDEAETGWGIYAPTVAKIDPESAARIKKTDPQRTNELLEVFTLAEKP